MEQKNEVAQQQPKPALPPDPIKEFFAAPSVLKKFQDLLGPTKGQAFVTSILQIVHSSDQLKSCTPKTIFTSAAVAATLDLPVNQQLGFAWIVGYKEQAQFQIGYKGYVQLAQRTGQYLRLNVIEVFANQFKSWNELTEELVADFTIPGSGEVVGYCSYFKLLNGFEKTVYWTKLKVDQHGKKYSQSYKSGKKSVWTDDFDSMAKKTVLKNMLSRWGILSVEMQRAIMVDQAVINDPDGLDVTYIDNVDDTDHSKARGERAAQNTMNFLDSRRQ